MRLKLVFLLTLSILVNFSFAQITEHQLEDLVLKGAKSMDDAYAKFDSLIKVSSTEDPMYDGLIMLRMEYGRKLGQLKTMNADIDYAIAKFNKTGEFFGEKAPPSAVSNMLNYKAINQKIMGEFDSAEATFRKAILIDPEHELLYNNLANTLIMNKKHQEALDVLALDKSSEELETEYYIKADAYYHIGEIDSASFYIKKYQEIERAAIDYAGHLLQGNIAVAKKQYKTACDAFYLAQQTFNAFYTENVDELKKAEDLAFWRSYLEQEKMAIEMEIHQNCP
jgi:tetratricopeptide (TPR) repeat protein